MKKIITIVLMLLVVAGAFVSCGNKNKETVGKVYYLNFKPEQDAAWQKLAKEYTDETGVKVTVLTAAEGTYESTLTSEIGKSNAPTMFQVNGPVGLANWKNYCYDLSGSEIYNQLTSKEFTLTENDKVYGIAYVIETYGIIYNKTLLNKYFSSDFSTVKSIEKINDFDSFSTVAKEIQANKAALGVDGAFTSAGMDSSSDWRFKTHLANMPIFYEYRDDDITSTSAIKGTYLNNYKAIWDLYVNNATCDKTAIATKTGNDAETEFKTGKAVFYQNGTWAYSACKYDAATNEGLKDEEFGMLPIYIGVEGEEMQGLCTGSDNYWCVNARASEQDIKATLNFMNWVVTSEKGTTALADEMNFSVPFKNAKPASNPLIRIANKYVEEGKYSVSWYFSTIPSDSWKNGVGTALTQYSAGTGSWDSVKKAFVEGWLSEYNAANR